MTCPKCQARMRRITTIDEHWAEWKCKCGFTYFGLAWETKVPERRP